MALKLLRPRPEICAPYRRAMLVESLRALLSHEAAPAGGEA
jgi:hypothetical protein